MTRVVLPADGHWGQHTGPLPSAVSLEVVARTRARIRAGARQRVADRERLEFRRSRVGATHPHCRGGVVMFGLGPATKIYLGAEAVDIRKGFEGLYGLVRDHLGQDPLGWTVMPPPVGASCFGGNNGMCNSSPNTWYADCECDCVGTSGRCSCGQGPPSTVCVVQHCCKLAGTCTPWSGGCAVSECYDIHYMPSNGASCACNEFMCF